MRIRSGVILFVGLLACPGCNKGAPTDDLIAKASSADEGDRLKAVRWLQHRQGDATKVVPVLTRSLKDGDADTRWSAAIGLGYYGKQAETAIPALETAERDRDARVREAARVALSRIGGKK